MHVQQWIVSTKNKHPLLLCSTYPRNNQCNAPKDSSRWRRTLVQLNKPGNKSSTRYCQAGHRCDIKDPVMDTAFLGSIESFLGEQAVSAGCEGDNRDDGWQTEQDSIKGYQRINAHVSSGWTGEPLVLSGTKCKDAESSPERDQNSVYVFSKQSVRSTRSGIVGPCKHWEAIIRRVVVRKEERCLRCAAFCNWGNKRLKKSE